MKKPSEVLDLAAAKAQELEHCKGCYTRDRAPPSLLGAGVVACCAEGAILLVDGWTRVPRQYLRDSIGTPQVTRWNDLPTTTKEDVVVALKKAAELARAAGE